jgi:hypothetical protein
MSEKGGFNWAMGCAIGCGGLIVLGLVAAGGLYFVASKGMEAGRVAIVEELQSDFEERMAEGEIPEDRRGLMTNLVDLATDDDTSLAMLLMCSAAYEVGVETDDDMDDEKRVAMIQKVIEFVSEDPSAGFIKMGTFMEQNPEYSDIFENLDGNTFEFGDEYRWEPESDEETPLMESDEPVEEPVEAAAVEPETEAEAVTVQ